MLSNISTIKADSGWDTSYDSGGSWDSGSDWSSGSDWDSSSSWDSDSSGSSSSEIYISNDNFYPLAFFIVFAVMLFIIVRSNSLTKNTKSENEYNIISLDKAQKVIPNFDIEQFNLKAYQMFYDIQIAWMNFDYDKLKNLLTDELYNSYIMQLESLKIKNQQNTMSSFELVEGRIFDLKEVNGKYIAKFYLSVKFYDYIEDTKTKKVLRGSSHRKIHNTYILTFISTKEKPSDTNECPKCGAKVKGSVTGTCEYCRSKLINKNYDWVMSKKEKISQK